MRQIEHRRFIDVAAIKFRNATIPEATFNFYKARENESMKRFAGKFGGSRCTVLLVLVAMVGTMLAGAMLPGTAALAQDASKIASIHGHVNNAAGMLIQNATVRLTTDHSTDPKTVKWAYTFPVDDKGDYKGTGIAPNTYIVVVFVTPEGQPGTVIDYFAEQTFKGGEDKLVNFDETRKDFIDKMTPEQRANLEEYKKRVAEAQKGNAKIANLNTTLQQARADIKSGNFDAAASSMKDATAAAPTEALLWITLGDAQLGQANKALKAAKSAGQPTTDPALVQKFTDAATSYKKTIDLNAASKKPNPDTAATAYNQMGQAYGQSGDVKDASDAYDQAAKADPSKAGMYLLNEAITLYNAGKTDDAATAADKAIAADPNNANAYYLKGQSLIQKVTVDPKTQKVTAPPGCAEAYQKYLQLAPDGAHAAEVKEILTGIGEKIQNNYKAGKK